MFTIVNVDTGYYVIDYKGNKLFYGTMKECKKFIKVIEKGLKM